MPPALRGSEIRIGWWSSPARKACVYQTRFQDSSDEKQRASTDLKTMVFIPQYPTRNEFPDREQRPGHPVGDSQPQTSRRATKGLAVTGANVVFEILQVLDVGGRLPSLRYVWSLMLALADLVPFRLTAVMDSRTIQNSRRRVMLLRQWQRPHVPEHLCVDMRYHSRDSCYFGDRSPAEAAIPSRASKSPPKTVSAHNSRDTRHSQAVENLFPLIPYQSAFSQHLGDLSGLCWIANLQQLAEAENSCTDRSHHSAGLCVVVWDRTEARAGKPKGGLASTDGVNVPPSRAMASGECRASYSQNSGHRIRPRDIRTEGRSLRGVNFSGRNEPVRTLIFRFRQLVHATSVRRCNSKGEVLWGFRAAEFEVDIVVTQGSEPEIVRRIQRAA
ncbi:hypothetical protein B0H19DRAFT_1071788 [Mycena capillaripes]|nr:hypothetical protein B0H19DRAFT_1071788 [Mycena capillaripes]